MKLLVNGMPLRVPVSGVGQYIRRLFQAMSQLPDVDTRFFYGHRLGTELIAPPTDNGGLMSRLYGLARSGLPGIRRIKQRIERQAFAHLVGNSRDFVYHEPNFVPFPYEGPTILTIHDLSCFDLPETHPAERVRLLQQQLPPALARAAHILTVSEFTRQKLHAEFGISLDRITTTLLAADADFRPHEAGELAPRLLTYGLNPGGYVLAVGTLEPRKNLNTLITAYASLDPALRQRFPLAVAGMRGWHVDSLDRAGSELASRGELRWLGYVSDDDLPALYAGARVFVYPSRYEGFGLPPLEAMASGIPVVTGNRTALPEVVGNAGTMIDPDDVQGFRDALYRLMTDDDLARTLGQAGLQRAGQFSWARCAAETRCIYQDVATRYGLPA